MQHNQENAKNHLASIIASHEKEGHTRSEQEIDFIFLEFNSMVLH